MKRRLALLLVTFAAFKAYGQVPPPPEDPKASQEMIEYSGAPLNLEVFKTPNLAIPWFNNGVAQEMPVKSCSLVMALYAGQLETIYAGDCLSQRDGQHVQLCADTGVGESKLLPVEASNETKEALLGFLEKWCPGG